jgi:hypothetical protein
MENQTDLDLANTALQLIGEDRVSLDNMVGSKKIQVVNQFLPLAKQETLRARDWNRARGRATLAALDAETLSLGEWSKAYRLPPDCLCFRRFVSTDPDTQFAAYNVEIDADDKQVLFTNCGTNKVVYTRNITDVNRWDSLLFAACAAKLAMDLAGPLIRDFKLQAAAFQMAQAKFDEAIGVNEGEGGHDRVYDDTLVSVRF